MKKTFLMFVPAFIAIALVPTGYEHWTAEQLKAREQALHTAMKNGLASETLGHWGNHLLLKTRREGSSGQAELHEKQADLIVVQSGQATIIIGGKVLNGKTTAANEIRGTSIEGGERQALKAGDIVHVPAKTPHQVLLDPGQTLDYVVLKWIRSKPTLLRRTNGPASLDKIERHVNNHVLLASDHAPASQLDQNLARIDAISLRSGFRVPKKAGIDPGETER
jgi:uncharacterized RmlC-like cupin family protein